MEVIQKENITKDSLLFDTDVKYLTTNQDN